MKGKSGLLSVYLYPWRKRWKDTFWSRICLELEVCWNLEWFGNRSEALKKMLHFLFRNIIHLNRSLHGIRNHLAEPTRARVTEYRVGPREQKLYTHSDQNKAPGFLRSVWVSCLTRTIPNSVPSWSRAPASAGRCNQPHSHYVHKELETHNALPWILSMPHLQPRRMVSDAEKIRDPKFHFSPSIDSNMFDVSAVYVGLLSGHNSLMPKLRLRDGQNQGPIARLIIYNAAQPICYG